MPRNGAEKIECRTAISWHCGETRLSVGAIAAKCTPDVAMVITGKLQPSLHSVVKSYKGSRGPKFRAGQIALKRRPAKVKQNNTNLHPNQSMHESREQDQILIFLATPLCKEAF